MTSLRKTVWTALFAASVLLSAQEQPEAELKTVTFSHEYSQPLRLTGYVSTPSLSKEFTRGIRQMENPEVEWEVEVSGEGGALAGAKFKTVTDQEGGTRLSAMFWNKKTSEKKVRFSGKFQIPAESPILTSTLLVFNCKKTGTVLIHSVKLTATGKPRAPVKPDPKTVKKIDPKAPVPQRELVFQPKQFTAGVYFYVGLNSLGKTREEAEAKFRLCMKDIAAHHCNTVYLSGISGNPEGFARCCKIAQECGLQVIAQGNGPLYLRTENGMGYFKSNSLPALRKMLPQLKADNLIGFTTKEEVDPTDSAVRILHLGRLEQRKLMTAPVFTLHNRLPSMAMDDDPENQPDWYAFDMYRFKLHPERHVIMTPSKAAFRIVTNLEIAYLHAAKFGRPLIFVAQGVKTYVTVKSKKYTKASGMTEISPGVWQGYGRYMPKHGMDLQFWLGVMSGCRGILIYHYMSGKVETALVDRDLKPQFYWTEFSDCLAEAEPLFPLFNTWYKQQPDPDAYSASSSTVRLRTFKHPDFQGTFILPVNILIARWDKNNPRLTTVKTQLHSDKENLQGFEWAEPQTFELKVKGEGKVYDVLTGKEADLQKITLGPGKGRVFFQGRAAELAAVREKFGIK